MIQGNVSMSRTNQNVRRINLRRIEPPPLLHQYHRHLLKKVAIETPKVGGGLRPKELQRSFKMSTSSNSCVSSVLFATLVPWRVVGATTRQWRRGTAALLNPYRPELHYMRGPGPKWREKHARGAGFAS